MSNVRFQIGIPRAGDAARDAEGQSSASEGWTRAKQVALSGSAARAAEERKRAEPPDMQSRKTIALRATGGAVVDSDTMLRHSAVPFRPAEGEASSHKNPVDLTNFPVREPITDPHTMSADTASVAAVSPGPGPGSQDNQASSGLLQHAAAHLQALTRSLFQRRNANG